jgi:hypothetical protein
MKSRDRPTSKVRQAFLLAVVVLTAPLWLAALYCEAGFRKEMACSRWQAQSAKSTAEVRNHLCEDSARRDKARLFVELNRDGIDELRETGRSVPIQKAWWGCGDPDRRSRWQ